MAGVIAGGPLTPTQGEQIMAPDRRTWFTGPYGSGKTTALVTAVVVPALLYPGSRWFVARSTYWTLQETTLKKFLAACNKVGPGFIIDREAGPPYKIWIASGLRRADGLPEEPSEILFHSLDDIDKLGSTEFSGIAVDEANEISEELATTLDGRLRWPLPGQTRPEGPFFLRFFSNPPNRTHWLHRKFCGEEDCEPTRWGRKFKSLPNENDHNLPPNYYADIAQGMNAQQRIRFVDGECGPSVYGMPVFTEFNYGLHTGSLKALPGVPMGRSWDFGRRRPAVVFYQNTPVGHVNRLSCMMGDNEPLSQFADKVLQRSANQFGMVKTWNDVCDPHGVQKRDVTEKTSISVLQEKGLNPRYRDVSVMSGLELMSKGLNTLVQGRPRSMYDRIGCNLLIEGYMGGYHWAEPTPGRPLREKPVPDGYYEHTMDCDRYIEVNLGLGSTIPYDQHRKVLRHVRNPATGY